MTKKKASPWPKFFARQMSTLTKGAIRAGVRSIARASKPMLAKHKAPAGAGDWLSGAAVTPTGLRHYRLFRPADPVRGERLALMVMLHGCGQDARGFAASTRMNVIAARERFLVLYPEQDILSNPHRCWNWFDSRSGRAFSEAASIMATIDQVCLLYQVDKDRIAVAGLSAGASMAALLVTRHPERFRAVAMHSGVPPGTAHSGMSAVGAMVGRRDTRPLAADALTAVAAWPPLLVIHGASDAVVASTNGRAAARVWADAFGARASAERSVRRGARYPTKVTDFKRSGVTMATLVEVERLGHAWSGGAASENFSDRHGPDASRMVWAFASKQFKARSPER